MQNRTQSGIPRVADLPWGSHFCQFYDQPDDLAEVLVPYFQAGLENNEYCLWVTGDQLPAAEASERMLSARPDLRRHLDRGQLTILDMREWYRGNRKFDSGEVLAGWLEREAWALGKGYTGMRLTGDTHWLERETWDDFREYEELVSRTFANRQFIALCTYCAGKCNAGDVIEVAHNHDFALLRREGEWRVLENTTATRLRKEVHKNEREFYYRSLINGLPVPIYTTDPDGRLTWYNQAAVEMWGREPEIGKESWCGFQRVYDQDYQPLDMEKSPIGVTVAQSQSVRGAEVIAERGDGTRFNILPYPTPLFNTAGDMVGAVNMLFDITEQKRIERQLRDDDLRKNEFLAMLGHELRNPLGALRSGVEIMEMGLDKPERILRIMQNSVDTMAKLLDDLLDLSRVIQGRIQLDSRRMDLCGPLGASISSVRQQCLKKRQDLVVDLQAPLHVDGDTTRLEQIFSNLLVNASKYTPEGGTVKVSAREVGGVVITRVQDDGIGIDLRDLDRIFEPFYQITPSGEAASGLGIGLALSKKLAELHGGRLTATSEGRGRGAVFEVRIPASVNAAKPAPEPGQDDEHTVLAASVVLVEDNRDVLTTFTLLLRNLGCEVRSAEDAEEGLRLIEAERPDVAFIDIGLPVMSGHEVAKRLRAGGFGGMLVAISGYSHKEAREKSREAGFDYHLAKPFKMTDITGILSVLENRN